MISPSYRPSGQSGGTQALSTQIALSLFAPWYTWRFGAADAVGDSISIVLIDDQAIGQLGGVYPLDYYEQLNLIKTITMRQGAAGGGADPKPVALFLDLVYADDRGDLASFGDDLQLEAQYGTRVGEHATALIRAYPPLAMDYAGILVADKVPRVPGRPAPAVSPDPSGVAATEAPGARSPYGAVNLLRAPAAPTLFAEAPLRYALAPDGILSPAAILALWMCGTDDRAAEWVGCAAEGFLRSDEIYDAAHAAAFLDVVSACKSLPAGVDWRERCGNAASALAAQAGWAPRTSNGRQPIDKHPSRPERVATLLAKYAAARRAGYFDGASAGAIAARHCLDSGGYSRRRCTDLAHYEEERIGPTMTVLWGAGPRDMPIAAPGENLADEDQPIAAPYVWAEGAEDKCEAFRIRRDRERLSATGLRLASAFLPAALGPSADRCAYHPQLQPSWIDSGVSRTQRYVDWALDGRVVMIGVSVAGVEDHLAMRGLLAPGVWGHAMALDNLLTLGADYRRASQDGLGFSDAGLMKAAGILREATIAAILALILTFFIKKRDQNKANENGNQSILISPQFAELLVTMLVGTVLLAPISLFISVSTLALLPWPPMDWLSVSALATLAWAATDCRKTEKTQA